MYPKAYIDYLVYFHTTRDYFECHEVLEEHWKMEPIGKRQTYWVGLIQLAVGLYHHRRGNTSGAIKMYKGASSIIKKQTNSLTKLGLLVPTLLNQINEQQEKIKTGDPTFCNLNLPLSEEVLLACKKRCLELSINWKLLDSEVDPFLIHKHTWRDRRDVIVEREKQLVLRQNQREE
ncbi:DUF309 domain-containing protein [bacterium LRH843]|nr:DUF309 domain-containing protein [bacterium LRH843]